MAGLRLDQQDAVFEARKRGAAVVAGKPDESLLFQRITSSSVARRMPPESSHKKLTEPQIALLKRWIEQGAKWQEHWSFRTPVKPTPAAVRNAQWVRNPVDRFILSKLESQGLTPAPSADRRTLIRRVALDTTGLPPKPLEVDQYLKDILPNAYERMVDRYLASPHYGEHRARYWLDAARYADTHGIHIDNYREIWPYRDWVIQAFNRNMPFDQFSIEQLAGDLLPGATFEQRIATGFHRCNVTTSEGGAIDDEYVEIYAKDRADTTGAVWLGLTVGCATCHDHKFDPISQKDFYALGAFFRNTPQKAMDGNVADTPPFIVVPPEGEREVWDRLQTQRASVRAAIADFRNVRIPEFDQWLSKQDKSSSEAPLGKDAEVYAADFEALAGGAGPWVQTSAEGGSPALHFGKDEGVPAPDTLKMDAEKPFSVNAVFFLPEKTERTFYIAAQQNAKEKGRGWLLEVNRRIAAFRLIGDDGQPIDVRTIDIGQMRPGAWHHLAATYDGSRQQSGLKLYVNGREILTQGRIGMRTDLPGSIEVSEPLLVGKAMAGGAIADLRVFNRVITESEAMLLREWPAIRTALAKQNSQRTEGDRSALMTWFLWQHAPFRELTAKLDRLNTEAGLISRRSAVTHVMYERPDAEPFANILFRGAYDQKRERVNAGTPGVLPPMRAGLPRNRLGFAKWLFAEENPLTSRVTVNRMWQEVFGTGLVKTTDDFGSQGESPSHPELLDWLAVDFRESGWDTRRFYKQLLMSATYRQAAQATPDKIAKDPENRLLSRGPRFRMDAEMVRDYALASSGLLSRGIGGPSVRPYQPDGIWEAVAMNGSNTRFYHRDAGEGLYRRSMYTFWKRSAPPASMDVFNAPTREACVVRRERTNTPLQALVTMNDTQFMEAARVLSERALQTLPAAGQRMSFMSTNILMRPLTAQENVVVQKAFSDFLAYYSEHPADAQKLLHTGERNPDPTLPPAEYAALTMVANQLFNLDEVLNK